MTWMILLAVACCLAFGLCLLTLAFLTVLNVAALLAGKLRHVPPELRVPWLAYPDRSR